MKWFGRREKVTPEIVVRHSNLTITHVVKKEPEPRPVRGWLTWTNANGERWRSQPFMISGNVSFPTQVPLAWLTGREKGIAKLPLDVSLELEY
jgi:hypothetical protein